jgi:hypothetical protein
MFTVVPVGPPLMWMTSLETIPYQFSFDSLLSANEDKRNNNSFIIYCTRIDAAREKGVLFYDSAYRTYNNSFDWIAVRDNEIEVWGNLKPCFRNAFGFHYAFEIDLIPCNKDLQPDLLQQLLANTIL